MCICQCACTCKANAILELAEEQLKNDLRTEACRNFHAGMTRIIRMYRLVCLIVCVWFSASVFFRVLESILPSMNYEIHEKLKISAQRVRESASLKENFIQEHFSGSSCSEFYDIHGRNKLGKGSYGSVYLATHRLTRDERAVKVMNVDRVTSYYLRKLHTEICILKEVDHPNIIKLQDVFFGRRSVYLVTDLCRGGELYELLTSGKSQGFVFREDRAGRLMNDMMSAVKYLHSIGIVHRDLKLENFLFEGNSSNSPLILIDFGLSKHYDSIERMRQRVGSCYYTAPEVLSGDYDERCDVWSLGVICYMLLSGTPPFYGKTPEDIHQSTLTKEAEFPSKRFRHVSEVAIDFMRRLLVKNPDERMTLGDALMHQFITGIKPPPDRDMSTQTELVTNKLQIVNSVNGPQIALPGLLKDNAVDILRSLRMFSSFPMLTKIVLEVIAYTMTADQVQDFRAEFLALDSDSSGTINMNELQALAVVGNTIIQSVTAGDSLDLIENVDNIMGGIINPRQRRGDTSNSHSGLTTDAAMIMEEDDDVVCCDNVKVDVNGIPLGSVSQDSFGTTESCSSMYTNPSSRSPHVGQKSGGPSISDGMQKFSLETSAVITYTEYIAAAICGRLVIEEDRVAAAFDLLDTNRQGTLTAEAVASFLGRDVDISMLHHDILLTKAQMQLKAASGGSSQIGNSSDEAAIDQETFFYGLAKCRMQSRGRCECG